MVKEKEKVLEVPVDDSENAKKMKIVVKKPNAIVSNQANAVYNKWLHTYMRDGIMTKAELEKFMIERGIWSEDKGEQERSLAQKIRGFTRDLYQGVKGKRKAAEGRKIAVQIKKSRAELQQLIAEKISLEQNTAESLADNMKFDYLVAECTYKDGGKEKVYSNLEDYSDKADEVIAFAAAAALAQMLYAIDPNFEADLPENQFLKMFNYVDKNFNLLDDKGHTVTADGQMIDEYGFFVNTKGEKVDSEGNLVDDRGNFVMFTEYTSDTTKTKSKSKEVNGQNVDSV